MSGLNIIGHNQALQDHEIKRIVAFIIDAIVVAIFSSILTVLLFPPFFGFVPFLFGVSALFFAVLALLYWGLQEGFMGATIGKKVMGLQVVGTTGPIDIPKAFLRNVSKIYGLALLLDWIVGLGTEGDPRQKVTDRFAGTTVVRTDSLAYMEEQFRQMATPPPHPAPPTGGPSAGPPWQAPAAPPAGGSTPPPSASPPQSSPPAGGWPGQATPSAGGGWPQHRWDEQGQLVPPSRFCSACGGALVPRGDGRLVCSRCGTVY